MGRPMKYSDPDKLQEAIDLYFESLVVDMPDGTTMSKPPLLSGLAYALDIDTETLRNYGKKDDFFGIVKRARQKVEMAFEERLLSNAPTGAIFNLKANFMYRDADTPRDSSSDVADALNKLADNLPK